MPSVPSFKNIWSVSFPIMLSILAQNIISITDIIYIGNYAALISGEKSEGMIGAVGMGTIYYIVLFMICFGFATGIQILVSRRNGEEKFYKIGEIIENGLLFLLILSIILIGISLIINTYFLHKVILSPEVLKYSKEFLNIRVIGLLFCAFSLSFRAFHVGITQTNALTYSSIISALVNILLNYIFIFGKFGIPEMGIKGAAIASISAEFIGALFFIIYNFDKKIRQKYQLFMFKTFKKKTVFKILNISIYVMLQYTLSLTTWLAFFLVVEKTGKDYLDSSQIVRSIYSLFGIPSWALAAATSSFVSNAIGQKNINSTFAIIKRLVLVSTSISIILIIFLFFFNNQILSLFNPSYHLIEISKPSVYIIIGALLLLSVGNIVLNGISGLGKTKISMFVEILALIFFILGLYLINTYFYTYPPAYWYTEYLYWGFLGVFSILYLCFGNWKSGIENI